MVGMGRESPEAGRGGGAWLVLLVASALAMAVVANQTAFIEYATSSDQLTLPSIAWDLFENRLANVAGWQFSRAPYFFPDLAWYSLLQAVLGDYRWSIFAACLSQVAVLAMVMGVLVRRVTGAPAVLAANTFLAIVVGETLIAIGADAVMPPYRAFYRVPLYSYQALLHYSSFLMAMAGLLVVIAFCRRQRPWHLPVLAVLTLLAMLSDFIFLAYFLAPMAAVLVWCRLSRRVAPRVAGGLLAAMAGGAMAALGLLQFVTRQPTPTYKIQPGNASNGLALIYNHVSIDQPVFVLIVWIPLAIALAFCVRVLVGWAFCRRDGGGWRRLWGFVWRGGPDEWSDGPGLMRIVLVYLLLATAANVLFGAVYISRDDDTLLRYFAVTTVFPQFCLTCLVAPRLARAGRRALLAGVVALPAAVLAVESVQAGSAVPLFLRWQSDLAAQLKACVPVYGLRAGLANYWLSRHVMMATDWTIQLAQLRTDEPRIYYWGNNLLWFTQDFSGSGQPPVYNFIILNRTEPNRTGPFRFELVGLYDDGDVTRHFGTPDRLVDCGPLRLGLYDDTALLGRNVLKSVAYGTR
jgi:hypothetical protein